MTVMEEVLQRAEKIIERIARKFQVDGFEFEDLVQVGRIKAWEIIESRKVTLNNFEEFAGLLSAGVKYALMNEQRRSKAKKRIDLSRAASLDQELGSNDDRILYDVLPAADDFRLSVNADVLKSLRRMALKTQGRDAIRGVVWVLVEMLNIERKDIPKKLKYPVFVKFGLGRFLWVFFNNSPYRAINYAYPGEFLPFQMARKPMRYWKGAWGRKRAVSALKIILEGTNYDPRHYPRLLSWSFLKEFGLGAAINICFRSNRYDYLNVAFPGIYHPWEFEITRLHFFDDEKNVSRATKWLIEEVLGFDVPNLSKEEVWEAKIDQKISKETFSQHGLRAIMAKFGSPEPVLRKVYPNKFLPWSFKRKGKWSGSGGRYLAAQATKWLIGEYFKISPHSARIDCEFFRRNGLWGMLTDKKLGFNTSPKAALKNAYPDLEFD